jgi:hypothetical protein
LVEPPNPFQKQRKVHLLGIEQSQASGFFGSANSWTVNKMILYFWLRPFPEELGSLRVEPRMNPIMEKEQTHHKH